jgi:hypothetical protein
VLQIKDVHPESRILTFTHPGSRIPNPGSRIQKQEQKRRVKKICCYTFFCSHKFHKIVNYFIFEMLKKKIWANFQRIIELFTQKPVTKLSKIWVWVKKPILDPSPGVKKAPDHGSATLLKIFVEDNVGTL